MQFSKVGLTNYFLHNQKLNVSLSLFKSSDLLSWSIFMPFVERDILELCWS